MVVVMEVKSKPRNIYRVTFILTQDVFRPIFTNHDPASNRTFSRHIHAPIHSPACARVIIANEISYNVSVNILEYLGIIVVLLERVRVTACVYF